MNYKRARGTKDYKWNWYKTKPNPQIYQQYIKTRNNYMAVRRETERNFEKGIVDKCKTQPGLFC